MSAGITAYFWLSAVLIMTCGAWLDRAGPRVFGSHLCARSPRSKRSGSFYLALALMAISWTTMTSSAINTILAPWLMRKRGLASSIALTGASFGGSAVIPLVAAATRAYGQRLGLELAIVSLGALVLLVAARGVCCQRWLLRVVRPSQASNLNACRIDARRRLHSTPSMRAARAIWGCASLGFALFFAGCDTFSSKPAANGCSPSGVCSFGCPPGALRCPGTAVSPPPPVATVGFPTFPPVQAVAGQAAIACPTCDGGVAWLDAGNPDDGDAGIEPGVTLTRLDVAAQAIVADAKRGRIYATVKLSAARYGDHLVTIDVARREVIHDVAIGADPGALAISADASTLWVSLEGDQALRRVDLTGDVPVPGEQFPLGAQCKNTGPCVAGRMVVLADSTERVLVTLRNAGQGPTTSGIREVDRGISRPMQLSYGNAPSELTLGPAGYVFGHGGDFYTIRVNADDVSATAYPAYLTKDYSELAYANGLVFTTQGEIADVTQPDNPKLLGKLPVKGLVLPLAKRGDALMLTTTGPTGINPMAELVLRRVSAASMSVVGSVKLPVPATLLNSFENKNLVRVGNSLAFIAQIVVDSPTNVFLVSGVSVVE